MTVNNLAENMAVRGHDGTGAPALGRRNAFGRPGDGNSIGALLVDAGKLSLDDAERVLRLQREQKLRFGEAAVQLGLVGPADIEVALSQQFEYPYLRPDDPALDAELIAAYQPFGQQVEALRGLRSQLMLRWFNADAGRKALAVVSPERGEGRSFVAANLAVVFSQLGEHTLLIDADLRHPRQHSLFRVDNAIGLSSILSGRAGREAAQRVEGLVDLSVLPAGAPPPNPQELLARPSFGRLLDDLAGEFDVIIIDTPAGNAYADAQTVAARAGGALMVVRANTSRVRPAGLLVQNLSAANAKLAGAVMNSF